MITELKTVGEVAQAIADGKEVIDSIGVRHFFMSIRQSYTIENIQDTLDEQALYIKEEPEQTPIEFIIELKEAWGIWSKEWDSLVNLDRLDHTDMKSFVRINYWQSFDWAKENLIPVTKEEYLKLAGGGE